MLLQYPLHFLLPSVATSYFQIYVAATDSHIWIYTMIHHYMNWKNFIAMILQNSSANKISSIL